MPYMELMKSTLSSLVAAGEAGRTTVDGMLGPLNGAVSDMTGAASELEGLPIIGPAVGAKLQRTMRAINATQSTVGMMASKYSQVTSAATQVRERLGTLGEQASKAGSAINRMAGKVSPSLASVVPSSAFAPSVTPVAAASTPFPHLLTLQPLKAGSQPFYFNLDTAAFDELQRRTAYRWAAQERLTRDIAQQAVGQGEDTLTIKGAVFPLFRGGISQLDALRAIGRLLLPVSLTTGYGAVLGNWCLRKVDEDQSSLLAGGIPRKQGFTLEFTKYGDDLQNV